MKKIDIINLIYECINIFNHSRNLNISLKILYRHFKGEPTSYELKKLFLYNIWEPFCIDIFFYSLKLIIFFLLILYIIHKYYVLKIYLINNIFNFISIRYIQIKSLTYKYIKKERIIQYNYVLYLLKLIIIKLIILFIKYIINFIIIIYTQIKSLTYKYIKKKHIKKYKNVLCLLKIILANSTFLKFNIIIYNIIKIIFNTTALFTFIYFIPYLLFFDYYNCYIQPMYILKNEIAVARNNIRYDVNYTQIINFFSIMYGDYSEYSLKEFFTFAFDGISLPLLILTTFLTYICILSIKQEIDFKEYFLLSLNIIIVEILLFITFSTTNILLFYIAFEALLIPIFFIIGRWGSRIRRVSAAYQFFLYTFVSSLCIIIAIGFIFKITGSLVYNDILYILSKKKNAETKFYFEYIMWLSFFIAFAVKIPLIPVHLWLPEAHVEAPTVGSMLLAGILLKIGAYGMLKFCVVMFPIATIYYTPIVIILGIISIFYASITALRQIDLKKIVAYSSIAHIGLVVIGIFSITLIGIEGALFLIISHGLVSAGIFYCVGTLYDRYNTRIISYYNGIADIIPSLATYYFIFSIANIGFPLTSGFIGEFGVLIGAGYYNNLIGFWAAFGVIFSASYTIWLYNRIFFGSLNSYIKKYSDLNSQEFSIIFLLSFFTLYFGLFPNTILNYIHSSVTYILFYISSM